MNMGGISGLTVAERQRCKEPHANTGNLRGQADSLFTHLINTFSTRASLLTSLKVFELFVWKRKLAPLGGFSPSQLKLIVMKWESSHGMSCQSIKPGCWVSAWSGPLGTNSSPRLAPRLILKELLSLSTGGSALKEQRLVLGQETGGALGTVAWRGTGMRALHRAMKLKEQRWESRNSEVQSSKKVKHRAAGISRIKACWH